MSLTLDKLHYVNLGKAGTFSSDGVLTSTSADVDALFAHLEKTNAKKLVLVFHGGLVSEAVGLAGATQLVEPLRNAGTHPVFFIWETGIVETVKNNLLTIGKTELFKKIVSVLIDKVGKRLGLDGAKGPGVSLAPETIESELAKEAPLDALPVSSIPPPSKAIEAEMRLELEEELGNDPKFHALLQEQAPAGMKPPASEGAKGPMLLGILATLAKVGYATLKRLSKGRDHGFYPTLIEELLRQVFVADFGTWIWDSIKSAAKDMWAPSAGLAVHGGAYFLEKLAAHQKAHPELVVDLVGHSAGAIAICRMLPAIVARFPDAKVRDIVFLAPACTIELFQQEIGSHPERFRAFRMFTMRDEQERQDHLVPGLYTRSLLYLVSGIFEGDADAPLLGLARHCSGLAPYDTPPLPTVGTYLAEPKMFRVVLSPSEALAAIGLRSGALTHGGFALDPSTVASVVFLVGQG
jgi:hypothetical protein